MNTLAEIEAARERLGATQAVLERVAGMRHYYYRELLAGRYEPSETTLAKLRTGLAKLKTRQLDGSAMTLCWRLAMALAAAALGHDAARCQNQDPARRATFSTDWMASADVRRLAMYLLNAGCGFSQSAVARAAGVTKQAVQQACRAVEDRRSDQTFDALADRLTAAIMGEL